MRYDVVDYHTITYSMNIINFLFSTATSTGYAFIPYLLGFYTILLFLDLAILIFARTRPLHSKEIKGFWRDLPSTLFYFVLAGLMLVVMRLSDVAVLSMGVWHLALLLLLIFSLRKAHTKYDDATRITVRRMERKAHAKEEEKAKDPYIEAQFSKKNSTKKAKKK